MAMTNVSVSLDDSFVETCLSWETNGFRYHIWTHDLDTLYKNPLLGCVRGNPGHFPTRKLDAKAHVNAQMIGLARIFAREQGAAEKAEERMRQEKAIEAEKNRVAYIKHCKREAAEEMYTALELVLKDGCHCRNTEDKDWHGDHCFIPVIRAALDKADGKLIGA